jgi:hypothetical protein
VRAIPSLVLLLAIARSTAADPLRLRTIAERTRHSSADTRHGAAAILAELVAHAKPDPDREGPIELALFAVLSDDSDVRTQMIDALVAKGLFRRADAARIPTLAVLGKQLRRLLVAKHRDEAPIVPTATTCRVLAVTARDATITCNGSECRHPCRHVRTTVTLRAGVQWSVVDQETIDNESGACGHCE